MTYMKSFIFHRFVAIATVILFGALAARCSHDDSVGDTPVVKYSGVVKSVSSYGEMELSFLTPDLNKVGIEYSDIVDITIGNDIHLTDVPFVTSFNEVALYSPCLCDYNATGKSLSCGMGNGDFSYRIGGQPGDAVTITLTKKQGYKDIHDIVNATYYYEREKYDSDEMFANFREITTSGMKPKTVYRSGNPLNCSSNAVRYAYVDKLASQVGIKTEIDLADTDAAIANYRKTDGYDAPYCLALYDSQQTIPLGLTADAFSPKFMNKLAEGLRFMISHEPPYLIHCNEGKDRCGFVSMLLEALAGATFDEVAKDYLVTFWNLNRTAVGSDCYNVRKKFGIDRMVWLLGHIDDANHVADVNWDSISPQSVNLHDAARQYMMQCGLSMSECDALEARIRS